MPRTIGQPVAWQHIHHEPIDGLLWCLYQNHNDPLRFVHATKPLVLTPPDKFTHDFGSLPWIVQKAMGGPAGKPDVAQHAGKMFPLHDWAYEHQKWDDGTPMNRNTADLLLYSALVACHCEEWYCKAVYAALVIGGKGHWKKHANGKIPPSTYGGYPWRS